jgi:hypothetical protein
MKRSLLTAMVVAAISFMAAPDVTAQSQASIGPDVGLWVDWGKIDLGLIADFLVTPEVSIQPGIHFVVGVDNTTVMLFDGNVHYNFAIRGQTFAPYIRGGLGVWYQSYSFNNVSGSSTDFHLNLGGGLTFNTRSNMQPFVGMNIAFIGGSDIKLHGGLKFAI